MTYRLVFTILIIWAFGVFMWLASWEISSGLKDVASAIRSCR